MNTKTQNKVDQVKSFLDKQGVFYLELNNGQLQVDGVNLWSTTQKWHDPKTNQKGEGVNSFLSYIINKLS